MGMVTLHIVIGVGVFILPLFLLLFTVVAMELAHVYIIIGSISFIASVLTTIVLVTKFINQPAAHGFFSYSDTFARLVFRPFQTKTFLKTYKFYDCSLEINYKLLYLNVGFVFSVH